MALCKVEKLEVGLRGLADSEWAADSSEATDGVIWKKKSAPNQLADAGDLPGAFSVPESARKIRVSYEGGKR